MFSTNISRSPKSLKSTSPSSKFLTTQNRPCKTQSINNAKTIQSEYQIETDQNYYHKINRQAAHSFFEENQNIIKNFKHLLNSQMQIKYEYNAWHALQKQKVNREFKNMRLQVQNFIQRHEIDLISSIDKSYSNFLQSLSNIRLKIELLYRQKMKFQKRRQFKIKYQQKNEQFEAFKIQQSPNKKFINNFKSENYDRQVYRQTNQFYQVYKEKLLEINEQTVEKLRFKRTMVNEEQKYQRYMLKVSKQIQKIVGKNDSKEGSRQHFLDAKVKNKVYYQFHL